MGCVASVGERASVRVGLRVSRWSDRSYRFALGIYVPLVQAICSASFDYLLDLLKCYACDGMVDRVTRVDEVECSCDCSAEVIFQQILLGLLYIFLII